MVQSEVLNQPFLPFGVGNIRLLKNGGFEVFDGFPSAIIYDALLREAIDHSNEAKRQKLLDDGIQAYRSGLPARQLFTCPGGPVSEFFL